jgi:hypothetical protein
LNGRFQFNNPGAAGFGRSGDSGVSPKPGSAFNSINPSPFRERDLDEAAERFILNWARDVSPASELKLAVTLQSPKEFGDCREQITQAVHEQFRRRSETVSRELRDLLWRGRISAVIGAAFLAATVLAGDLTSRLLGQSHTNAIIQEGLQLLGWVSTWRPIEIFLYGWWPLVGDRKLNDRLSRMPVSVFHDRANVEF